MIRVMADAVLLALGAETALLFRHRARTGSGPAPGDLSGALGAGLFLALALREAGARRRPSRIAPLLLLAGGAHLFDLAGRFRQSGRRAKGDDP